MRDVRVNIFQVPHTYIHICKHTKIYVQSKRNSFIKTSSIWESKYLYNNYNKSSINYLLC